MAAEGSWSGIERHGLRSTTALLDLFEVRGERRTELESRHRPECVSIEHPSYGRAVIRDQKPMDDPGLRRALTDGLAPTDWYRILNKKVFFWLTRERLTKLRTARAYRDKRQTVIVVDTRRLLERNHERVVLSPMNSGCTKPMAHPRGLNTFLPLSDYPYQDRERRGLEPIVELAVESLVQEIHAVILTVLEIGGGTPPNTILGSPSDIE
jgi:hypothetical protein